MASSHGDARVWSLQPAPVGSCVAVVPRLTLPSSCAPPCHAVLCTESFDDDWRALLRKFDSPATAGQSQTSKHMNNHRQRSAAALSDEDACDVVEGVRQVLQA